MDWKWWITPVGKAEPVDLNVKTDRPKAVAAVLVFAAVAVAVAYGGVGDAFNLVMGCVLVLIICAFPLAVLAVGLLVLRQIVRLCRA